MLSRDLGCSPLGNYLSGQTELTEVMRATVLDWLVEVHLKFKMFPQTWYIVVALIDQYLSKKPVSKHRLQLVATAALFTAAKYEETYRVLEAR